MRRSRIVPALLALMSVSACTASPTPAIPLPARSPFAAPASASAPATVPVSADAAKACGLAAAAPRPGEAIEIDEEQIKSIIGYAGTSAVESLERAGAKVRTGYSAWLKAGIGDEAATASDKLLEAVAELKSACAEAGLTP
ncbi:hypothetical protein [Actinoplanes sp. NPDC026670]|uniref:hypothetical protein n=1 Tax=Actinoplanes sp. NPDC026670 TaxID=3154700 RepID=UPI0033CAA995